MGLSFDAETHEYQWDGAPVPSVTQILKGCGMSDFSYVDPDLLEYKAQLGTAVHLGIELLDRGILNHDSVDEVIGRHLKQWVLFKDFADARGWMTGHCYAEKKLYSGDAYAFAGTIDQAILSADCKSATIIDIKTGVPSPAHALQLAGYEHLIRAQYPTIRKCVRIAVYLSPNAYKIDKFGDDSDIMIFRSCVNVYRFKQKVGLL